MLGPRPPAAPHAGSVEIFPDDPVRLAPGRVDGVLLSTLTAVLREVGEAGAGLVPVVLSAAGQEDGDDDRDGGAFHLTPPPGARSATPYTPLAPQPARTSARRGAQRKSQHFIAVLLTINVAETMFLYALPRAHRRWRQAQRPGSPGGPPGREMRSITGRRCSRRRFPSRQSRCSDSRSASRQKLSAGGY